MRRRKAGRDAPAKAAQAAAIRVPFACRRRDETLTAEIVGRRAQIVAARSQFIPAFRRRIAVALDAFGHRGPFLPPAFVIADMRLQLLSDLVDLAQRRRALRRHLNAEHHALRPHVVAREILKPVAHAVLSSIR